jgi:UDP-arabinose 4-epimerase
MTINVLVTGGTGYIGSHTAKLHESSVRWGPLVRGDILDADRLTRTIAQYEPKAVIHSDLGTIVRTAAPFFGLEARA